MLYLLHSHILDLQSHNSARLKFWPGDLWHAWDSTASDLGREDHARCTEYILHTPYLQVRCTPKYSVQGGFKHSHVFV